MHNITALAAAGVDTVVGTTGWHGRLDEAVEAVAIAGTGMDRCRCRSTKDAVDDRTGYRDVTRTAHAHAHGKGCAVAGSG